jgi:hypothetical protein
MSLLITDPLITDYLGETAILAKTRLIVAPTLTGKKIGDTK